MHAIPLSDDIDIYIGQGEGIHAKTNLTYIHSGSNLASKACKLFYSELATRGLISTQLPGVLIDIKKRIPVGAGLGGGSADSAAVLKVLNKHYNYPFTLDELSELGARLGSDVPFCIRGGCALCEGVGDIITPKNTLPPCFIVLAKPIASISTAEIFGSYKMERKRMRPDTQGTLSALEKAI